MIHITVYEKENRLEAFKIEGHANSGPYGYDLVCAAVSAVSFGAVNAVIELCEIDLIIDQAGEGGYLFVEIPSDVSMSIKDKASYIFRAMLISLQTIEREYDTFIKITI